MLLQYVEELRASIQKVIDQHNADIAELTKAVEEALRAADEAGTSAAESAEKACACAKTACVCAQRAKKAADTVSETIKDYYIFFVILIADGLSADEWEAIKATSYGGASDAYTGTELIADGRYSYEAQWYTLREELEATLALMGRIADIEPLNENGEITITLEMMGVTDITPVDENGEVTLTAIDCKCMN